MEYNFIFRSVLRFQDEILSGLLLTLQLSVSAMLIGLLIGIAGAVLSGVPQPWLRHPVRAYVELIRNTPLLVQLFIVFFGLPTLGIRLNANEAALVALSINLGAYSTEIIRAGIESLPRSQIEAGRALGLTALQTFRYIVLYQAVKAIYPALASQFVLLMLATSIVSAIGATELFHQAAFIESRTYRSFEVYTLITLSYLLLTVGFRGFFSLVYWAVFVRRPSR
jgi:amine acid ABC transporter, permease protein, 3-TM region, His/Glu/Gln/Arg/opine family